MKKMNSKNRRVLSGVLISLWLVPVCLGWFYSNRVLLRWNVVPVDGVVVGSANGEVLIAYAAGQGGFPLRFIEFTDFSNGDRARKYDLRRGILNLVLVGLNLIGIVVAIQKPSWQFSIRLLMLLTVVFAVLIVCAQSANFTFLFFVRVAYFLPLIVGGMILLLGSRDGSKRQELEPD